MDISDFQCKCFECRHRVPDPALLRMLEEIEDHFNQDINITSGMRCPRHNERIGGSKNSYHTKAKAVDFHITGIPLQEIYDWIDQNSPRCGLGIYNSHVHIDSRDRPARWDYRTNA